MEFIIDNLGKFFLIVLASVAGWFTYNKWQERDQWKKLGEDFGAAIELVSTSPASQDDTQKSNYWKFLARVKDFQRDVDAGRIKPMPPKEVDAPDDVKSDLATRWLLDAALRNVSDADASKPILTDVVLDNMALCDRFGIFSKEGNFEKMIDGKAPFITTGPFTGVTLTISQRVSPAVAPSIARHHANFTLVPEAIAGIISPDLDDKTYQFASRLKTAQVLKPEEFEDLYKMYLMGRK